MLATIQRALRTTWPRLDVSRSSVRLLRFSSASGAWRIAKPSQRPCLTHLLVFVQASALPVKEIAVKDKKKKDKKAKKGTSCKRGQSCKPKGGHCAPCQLRAELLLCALLYA